MKIRDRKRRIPAWENQEHTVALIEKMLDPTASVEHNVRLPVLNARRRRTRQCDVVIRTGPPARRYLTIVEVQKRGRVVGQKDFADWLRKKEQVGANALICVSEAGFTSTVVEDAQAQGGRVRLVRLSSEVKHLLPPMALDPTFHFVSWSFSPKDGDLGVAKVKDLPEGHKRRMASERHLSLGEGGPLLSLPEVLNEVALMHRPPAQREPIEIEVDLGALPLPLWLHSAEGLKYRVLQWTVTLVGTPTIEQVPLTVTQRSYLEEGLAQPLASVMHGEASHPIADVSLSMVWRNGQ